MLKEVLRMIQKTVLSHCYAEPIVPCGKKDLAIGFVAFRIE